MMSASAKQFIDKYGLKTTVDGIANSLNKHARNGLPIKSYDISLHGEDADFDETEGGREALLITVHFDADLATTYNLWKDARPALSQAASAVETDGLIEFAFEAERA
jgi:hypothetical protein